ncbi:phosphonate C-P lyase system protein PhnH [Ancylobacter sp. 6x-1]|uniref:Phosphonate C-P lyase system protein PhnH n=1 Tax=Ancylobacter crimeensis TaxID=2579147 RepID=A0ABT0D9K9_9HYPH|nr:phosphonate C-P lyase system protein PhnH [Ancylobacter crimeensis]MCK0196641.1 phosphonate C-P lyase system protein PhnH [Ancylobacter crimeensis]
MVCAITPVPTLPAAVPGPGFADPVFGAQAVFRAVMNALARPGRPAALVAGFTPPVPLTPEAAAVVLALCDHETPIWLDAPLAAVPEVAAFLRFHTGAPVVTDPAAARFALIADPMGMPDLAAFPTGTPDYPDASATLVLQVSGLADAGTDAVSLHLEGPGVKGAERIAAGPLPADLARRLAANRRLFPRGVDLILAAPGAVVGLPRSTLVREG